MLIVINDLCMHGMGACAYCVLEKKSYLSIFLNEAIDIGNLDPS